MLNNTIIKLLFPVTFLVFFIFGLYVTFPGQVLNASISKYLESTLFGRPGQRTMEPGDVSIGGVSLWRLSGVSLSKVTIREPATEKGKGSVWNLDSLRVRLGLLSLLAGDRTIYFDADLYEASVDGSVAMSKENQLTKGSLYVDALDLKKIPAVLQKLSLTSGTLTLDADLDFGKDPSKDGQGYLDLKLAHTEMFGVKPGDINASFSFEKGQGKSKPIKLAGGDVSAEANISLDLNRDLMRSRIEGSGWFKFSSDFEKKNSILVANLASRKDASGQYPFRLYGSLDSPIPSWGALRSRSFDRNNPLRSFEQ